MKQTMHAMQVKTTVVCVHKGVSDDYTDHREEPKILNDTLEQVSSKGVSEWIKGSKIQWFVIILWKSQRPTHTLLVKKPRHILLVKKMPCP